MTLGQHPELADWNRSALIPGICSVTLRQRNIGEVVDVVSEAGLAGIEWGTDVHIRDAASADEARDATAASGLEVLSLGSYYRVGSFGDFAAPADLAVRLGAPRIRVWAGEHGSAQAGPDAWDAVVQDARRIAELASERSLEIAFEYHGGTLTDSADTTLQLLERVDRVNVRTYWQPAVGLSDQAALESLRRVLPYVSGVHCFSWWPEQERLPLSGRKQLWQSVADILREAGRPLDMMLEFVAEDLPANVSSDAGFLNHIALGED
ncbi:sugar phosphate isomerase/epimerase [Arthrobacter sp. ISL-48]|uniref:sugar phosphate isomerase/epimerase family protein n=1 Tax=Arthrobacter sp. ISL-48 TaxID=2819110 RepID=UPI001BE59CE4|nr:sugar phosphate isomerase/epimerase [Arthrobacter sp. ISL-48]MBT2531591.1 sugar phosphate isomerase/epimerase [Arthrobacter sp. ISL-48]